MSNSKTSDPAPAGAKVAIWKIRFVVVIVAGVFTFLSVTPESDFRALCGGLAATLFGSLFVGTLSSLASHNPRLDESAFGKWLYVQSTRGVGPKLLGVLEAFVFYSVLVLGNGELVIGWLGFKAASKWAAWQHIMQLPDRLEDDELKELKMDSVTYMAIRESLATRMLTSFLVGTLANIAVAMIGGGVARIVAAHFGITSLIP